MKKKLSKTDVEKQIQEFFLNIKSKGPKEIKKIKRLAMAHNYKLKEKRKLFCKNCLNPYINPEIRIKNKIKIVKCEQCEIVSRWKIK